MKRASCRDKEFPEIRAWPGYDSKNGTNDAIFSANNTCPRQRDTTVVIVRGTTRGLPPSRPVFRFFFAEPLPGNVLLDPGPAALSLFFHRFSMSVFLIKWKYILTEGFDHVRVCTLGGRQRRRRTSFLRVSHIKKKHQPRAGRIFFLTADVNESRLTRKYIPGTRRPDGGPETGRRHSATTGKPLPSPAPPTLPERGPELSVRGAVSVFPRYFSRRKRHGPAGDEYPGVCAFVSRLRRNRGATTRRLLLRDAGRNPTLAHSARPPGDDTHARAHVHPDVRTFRPQMRFSAGLQECAREARRRHRLGRDRWPIGENVVPPPNGGDGGGSIDSAF